MAGVIGGGCVAAESVDTTTLRDQDTAPLQRCEGVRRVFAVFAHPECAHLAGLLVADLRKGISPR